MILSYISNTCTIYNLTFMLSKILTFKKNLFCPISFLQLYVDFEYNDEY